SLVWTRSCLSTRNSTPGVTLARIRRTALEPRSSTASRSAMAGVSRAVTGQSNYGIVTHPAAKPAIRSQPVLNETVMSRALRSGPCRRLPDWCSGPVFIHGGSPLEASRDRDAPRALDSPRGSSGTGPADRLGRELPVSAVLGVVQVVQ